jgi:uncharacterized protein YhhL (DUF1145 family)
MIIETQSTFDVAWQFAIFAAFVHLVLMKLPQQADSSLQILTSWSVALLGVVIFLVWRAVSLAEGVGLFALFNLTFVGLSIFC